MIQASVLAVYEIAHDFESLSYPAQKCVRMQSTNSGGSKVKQGIQNVKDKLSGHTMAASGPIAPATGTSGGSASTTGHA